MSKQTENFIFPSEEIVQAVLARLVQLQEGWSVEALQELFWTDLGYTRQNLPLAYENWPVAIRQYLRVENPLLLLATGGKDNCFDIIVIHLADSELVTEQERAVITQLRMEARNDALFICSNAACQKWQFIYVKSTHGQGKPSILRRISVRAEKHLRPVAERLSRLTLAGRADVSLSALQGLYELTFDVETVTRQFCEECSRLLRVLEKERREHVDDVKKAHDDALQFLHRCILLHFLQCKGWFENEQEFLQALRQDAFTISDAHIAQVSTFFQHYAFTLKEANPLDGEVAIDPEIPGTVYEKLVNGPFEANERGKAGIFYTPRTEIDLMCRLALVDNLASKLGQDYRQTFYDVVFALEAHEKSAMEDALTALGLWDELDTYLKKVIVLDPACGSGSFLVRMLYVLDELQERVDRHCGRHEMAFIRKKNIVERNLYGMDVKEWAIRITEQRLWLALLADTPVDVWDKTVYSGTSLQKVPSSYLSFKLHCGDNLVQDMPFREVRGEERGGFDIVIGNPPYVRQEKIGDPSSRGEQYHNGLTVGDYKTRLARTIYAAFPHFFSYKKDEGKAEHKINAQSDLYIYFYLSGLQLLNRRGTLCFITSNAWLDVRYGADLQEFLLRYCRIQLILDNQVERSFASADINTVILLCSAPALEPGAVEMEHMARFVALHVLFEQALSAEIFHEITQATKMVTTPLWRVHPIRQKALLEAGYGAEEQGAKTPLEEIRPVYTVKNWSGTYLRAPDIYWTLLEKGKEKLVRPGQIAEVRRGMTTGANTFFYLEKAKLQQWQIEEEFLQAALRSPRERKSITLPPDALTAKLFLCTKTKEELVGTGALRYIEWGEAQGYHRRPSCASRARWWDLGKRSPSHLGFNYLIDATAKTLYSPGGTYFSDNFQEIIAPQHLIVPLCATLNSTIFQLIANVAGRTNFGGGLLKIQTYELAHLLCVHPELIPVDAVDLAGIFSSADWDVLTPSAERRTLDTIIFDVLELTQGERDGVYEAVIEMVRRRITKSGQRRGKALDR